MNNLRMKIVDETHNQGGGVVTHPSGNLFRLHVTTLPRVSKTEDIVWIFIIFFWEKEIRWNLLFPRKKTGYGEHALIVE